MCKDRSGVMDGYEYIRIVLAVTILGMLKTTSLILAFVCIGMYFVRFFEVKNRSFWLRTVPVRSFHRLLAVLEDFLPD